MQPLAGIRVVELGGFIAAPYATHLLRDLGAEVIKVEPLTGDIARQYGPFVDGMPDPETSGLFIALNPGKQSVALDLTRDEDRRTLASLLQNADVFIFDQTKVRLDDFKNDLAALRRSNPGLVTVELTVTGDTHEGAPVAQHAIDACALSGVAHILGEANRAPLIMPFHQPDFQAGAHGAGAAVMALLARDNNGRGQHIEVASTDVLACATSTNGLTFRHYGALRWEREGRRATGSGGAYPYTILPCKDGLVCLMGRARLEWDRLILAMGEPEWSRNKRYHDLRAMGMEYADEVDALLTPWLMQHTRDELAKIAAQFNFPLGPVRTIDEVVASTQLEYRRYFRYVAHRRLGSVKVPGVPWQLNEKTSNVWPAAPLLNSSKAACWIRPRTVSVTPMASGDEDRVSEPAALRRKNLNEESVDPKTHKPESLNSASSHAKTRSTHGQHTVYAESGHSHRKDTQASESPADGPLAGLRVLDFGWVWSGPLVGTVLAAFGAEVIRVEHEGRLDNMRLRGYPTIMGWEPTGPTVECNPYFNQINYDKDSITVNLKHPQGQALLHRLIPMTDIVIENLTPGALARQGFGWEELSRINSGLMMLSMSSTGQHGPLNNFRAYAPIMSSYYGLEALVGYPGEAPTGMMNFGYGDPNAAAHALPPLFAALFERNRTGRGRYIDMSQTEAVVSVLVEPILEWTLNSKLMQPRGSRHRSMAPHGTFPVAGNDQWISIAVEDDAAWARLVRLLGSPNWATDSKLVTLAGRLQAQDEIEARLAEWTLQHQRDSIVEQLRTNGIAASPVQTLDEVWASPRNQARNLRVPVQHPYLGEQFISRWPWQMDATPPRVTRAAPLLGNANERVFGHLLGLTTAEIKQLTEAGVIA